MTTYVPNAFRHFSNSDYEYSTLDNRTIAYAKTSSVRSSLSLSEVSPCSHSHSISPTDFQHPYLYRKSCLDLIVYVNLIANDATRNGARRFILRSDWLPAINNLAQKSTTTRPIYTNHINQNCTRDSQMLVHLLFLEMWSRLESDAANEALSVLV